MAFGPVNVPGADDKELQAAKAAAENAIKALANHEKADNPHGITAAGIGAASGSHSHSFESLSGKVFHAGTAAPDNTGLLWIDTTANTGGLKYHNGSAWVHVPVSST